MRTRHLFAGLLALSILVSACGGTDRATPTPVPVSTATSTPLPSPTPPLTLWIGAAVPDQLREQVLSWGLSPVASPDAARVTVDLVSQSSTGSQKSIWIYALVAAFPTVRDGVTGDELKAAWSGGGQVLVMTGSTLEALRSVLGEPGPGVVRVVPAGALVDTLWNERSAWGVVPFEALDPKLKVLTVDGKSPVRKDFDAQKYPLAATFALSGAGSDRFPVTNRDPALLATVVMTGVTALVRATAVVMNEKGVEYPGRDIHDWLAGADITHISNEISFAEDCPPPDPNQTRLIFCSDPKFIGLLDYIGADVIELTGNHVEDWGSEALRHTIKMYNEHNMAYYGGGLDLADSKRTAKFTVNGNKIAFVGCNTAGPEMAWAREGYPGATPCEDGQWMTDTVRQLQADGYMVIVTFQHYEYYTPEMRPDQKHDFEAMIDAGATLVSGSQAHFPQVMEFYNGSFIHYGLGNLFFDQMRYEYSNGTSTDGTRREFIDRHVFYNGRHISTELLTAQLEEYARPRPMTPEERTAFLQEYFTASGW